MDVETTEAIVALGSRIDHLQVSLRSEMGELRGEVSGLRAEVGELRGEVTGLRGEVGELRGEVTELRREVTELRGEVTELRGEMRHLGTELRSEMGQLRIELRDELALNWTRTQLLVEDVRGDIRLLADAVATLSKKNGRRR